MSASCGGKAVGATRREEVTYPCPACGQGVLAITSATDGIMRGLYCRKCKTRQAVTLIGSTPAPVPPPPRMVPPPRAVPSPGPVSAPPIERGPVRSHGARAGSGGWSG